MRTEIFLIGQILEALENLFVGSKAGDAEGHHDHLAAVFAPEFHVGSDPSLGFGAATRKVEHRHFRLILEQLLNRLLELGARDNIVRFILGGEKSAAIEIAGTVLVYHSGPARRSASATQPRKGPNA